MTQPLPEDDYADVLEYERKVAEARAVAGPEAPTHE